MALAERVRKPAAPLGPGEGDAAACDLYAQAAYWALSAHAEVAAPSPPASAGERVAPPSAIWQGADPDLLLRAAGDAATVERLRSTISERSFVDFAELERARRAELVDELAAFVTELLAPLRTERQKLARVWTMRLVRIGLVVAGLAAIALSALLIAGAQDERYNLALRASWTASSDARVGGCRSPAQNCTEGQNYFFHTRLEREPFVKFDLGKVRSFSRITVQNRLDCCIERAVPLVIEVSSDGTTWSRVARNARVFTVWRAKFPRVRARFVKIGLPSNGILHLSGVRILP